MKLKFLTLKIQNSNRSKLNSNKYLNIHPDLYIQWATNGIVLTQKKAEKIPEEEPLLPFGSSRCPNKYRGPKHNNECSYGCGACDGRRCLQVCVGPKRLLMSVRVFFIFFSQVNSFFFLTTFLYFSHVAS